MKIQLVKTWEEIAAHLDWSGDALAILKVINFVSPRGWTFEFTFEAAVGTVLTVTPSVALTEEDVHMVFNGQIPEMFAANELEIIGGVSTAAQIPRNRDSAGSSEFIVEGDWSSGVEVFKLKGFMGFSLPVQLQQHNRVHEYLVEKTRFGATTNWPLGFHVTWRVLGNERRYEPTSRIARQKARHIQYYEHEINLENLAHVRMYTSPKQAETSWYHVDWGQFVPLLDPAWEARLNKTGNWIIEIKNRNIKLNPLGVLGPRELMLRIVDAIINRTEELIVSPAYNEFIDDIHEAKKREAAARLTQRQNRLRNAQFVYYRDQVVWRVPTSENELVALVMKLEALGALPLDVCRVLEYTTQKGIDALCDFRFLPGEALNRFAPLEFEFILENFFLHEHPEEQVRLIVCWDSRDEDQLLSGGCLRRTDKPWLFKLPERSVPVIFISRCPGINVDNWRE